MRQFDYIPCESVEAACTALDRRRGHARILAGGTDLLLELHRLTAPFPGTIVDISRVAPLRGIGVQNGDIAIGPLTTHAELSRSAALLEKATFLAAAARAIGSPQIRNRGTIGGNIMNAAACADTVPPLIALGARLTLRSVRGERVIPIDEFFEKPYRTVARDDEVLTLISFPVLPANARSAFLKLGRRNALSIARLSVAAVVAMDGEGVITEAGIVPGAAFPVWQRIPEAEALLKGERPSGALFEAAGATVAKAMVEITGRRWSSEYKEPVLAVMVRRALAHCCAERPGGGTP